jgi:two-component system, NarL family, response regulator NreC
MSKIRLLLVDDHPIVRAGLRAVLDSEPDMQVVGEAVDGPSSVERTLVLQPDVVVMDIALGETSGLAATREIRARSPQTRVLVLTMHENEEYLRQMLDAGATGYLIKKASGTELALAIRAVQRGELYVYSSLTTALLHSRVGRPERGPEQPSGVESLSHRERQVLCLVAQGYSSRQIGEKLFLSVRTVDTYRARLMEKLNLNSRIALIRYALDSGLLDAPESQSLCD